MPRAVSERFLREIRRWRSSLGVPFRVQFRRKNPKRIHWGGDSDFCLPPPLRNFTADLLVGLGPSSPIEPRRLFFVVEIRCWPVGWQQKKRGFISACCLSDSPPNLRRRVLLSLFCLCSQPDSHPYRLQFSFMKFLKPIYRL